MTQAFKISCDWELDRVDAADLKRPLAKRDQGFLLPRKKERKKEKNLLDTIACASQVNINKRPWKQLQTA